MSMFFFSSRRRHTRSLRDWSSDVCSSDLKLTGETVSVHDAAGCQKLERLFNDWLRLERQTLELAKQRTHGAPATPDRKSTRLNSSHVEISYAVFCLKKKKNKYTKKNDKRH